MILRKLKGDNFSGEPNGIFYLTHSVNLQLLITASGFMEDHNFNPFLMIDVFIIYTESFFSNRIYIKWKKSNYVCYYSRSNGLIFVTASLVEIEPGN